MEIILIIFFSFIKCEEISYNHSNTENNLYFVFSTFRHSARTTFNFIDYFYNWITPASITEYGKKQSILIGQNYRKRYSNYLNMSFDKNEFYIRISDSERVKITTQKQLEGLFNKTIETDNFDLVKQGKLFKNLYFENEDRDKAEKYFKFCSRRKLDNDQDIDKMHRKKFEDEIFPILKDCFGAIFKPISLHYFCDSVFSAYYEYEFGNKKDNKIGKCGSETAKKMFEFCDDWYKTFKYSNEEGSYMLYFLYNHIFEFMYKAINGTSPLKMMMIGGHDITIIPFMDFLDKLKIIPYTEYPHFGFNIVIELRKYNDDFYLEFYYNDVLKYNDTLKNFKNILDNSKYSNLYNYCGNPPWDMRISNNTLNDTKMINEANNNMTKKGNATQFPKNKNDTKNDDKEINKKEDKDNITIDDKEISKTVDKNDTKINDKEIKLTKDKNDTKIDEKQINKAEDKNNIKIDEKEINKKDNNSKSKNNIIINNQILKSENTFKKKLQKLLKQEDDLSFYIILGSILVIALVIIFFIFFLIVYMRKRNKRKHFIKLKDESNISNVTDSL